MYALERRVLLRTGHCLRDCWTRYAVCANRPLLERVRAGQHRPKDWRIVFVLCAKQDLTKNFARTA